MSSWMVSHAPSGALFVGLIVVIATAAAPIIAEAAAIRSLETLVPRGGGEVYLGEFAKGRDQTTAIRGAARHNDTAGLDAFQGDGGDVGSQPLVKSGRDGDRLPSSDEF
jgi:hypothetical protein